MLNEDHSPAYRAGERESSVPCPHCALGIRRRENVLSCPDCGAVHHYRCWRREGGCGSYECASPRRNTDDRTSADLRITASELAAAVPVARAAPSALSAAFVKQAASADHRTSRIAIAALVVGIVGIPLFGLVTGLIAIVLGSIAIGSIRRKDQRGTRLALVGILLGVVDMTGWIIALALFAPRFAPETDPDSFELDLTALENVAEPIQRGMRANVLIETYDGAGRLEGVGSGVIVQTTGRTALIVTNRHVVDSNFANGPAQADVGDVPERLSVAVVGQPAQPGTLVWFATDGIDLCLVSVPLVNDEARAATIRSETQLGIGDEVFAIGNPHRLGWTHTRGTVSQLRVQHKGAHRLRIVQTSAAINRGNSGGGLYNAEGQLVAINTWSYDKRESEGISFAISVDSLLKLKPPFAQPGDDEPAETP